MCVVILIAKIFLNFLVDTHFNIREIMGGFWRNFFAKYLRVYPLFMSDNSYYTLHITMDLSNVVLISVLLRRDNLTMAALIKESIKLGLTYNFKG